MRDGAAVERGEGGRRGGARHKDGWTRGDGREQLKITSAKATLEAREA